MNNQLSLKEIEKCICCDNKLDESLFLFKKHNANYYTCSNCGLVYQNPQPIYHFTEEIYDGEHYHERYIRSEYIYLPTSRIYLKNIDKELKDIIKNRSEINLVDIGCGIGYFLHLAKLDGYNVIGIDISKWAGVYAKKKFDIDVITGNFLEMNIPSSTYDIVTLWQTIEHLPSPNLFMNKINKILKPGGFVCIATPDVRSWIAKFYGKLWNCYMPNEHIGLFNFKSMKILLEKNDFEPVVVKRIREREFFLEQVEFLKLFLVRIIKNFVLFTKIFKPLFPKILMKKWEVQTDLEIPLPSIAYSVFAIGRKK